MERTKKLRYHIGKMLRDSGKPKENKPYHGRKRKNVPAGYDKIYRRAPDTFLSLEEYDEELSLPYLPAIVRFIYHL